jgi:hypothetical protein
MIVISSIGPKKIVILFLLVLCLCTIIVLVPYSTSHRTVAVIWPVHCEVSILELGIHCQSRSTDRHLRDESTVILIWSYLIEFVVSITKTS